MKQQLFLFLMLGLSLLALSQSFSQSPSSITFLRFFGLSTFFLLCISLIIGPLTVLWPAKFAHFIAERRGVGISSFIFLVAHAFLAVLFYFNMDFELMLSQLPIQLSIPAAILFFVITLTSTDYSFKKLGPTLWKNIQRLTYVAFALSFVHFVLSAKVLRAETFSLTAYSAELSMLLLGIMTVCLQVAGFITMRNKLKPKAQDPTMPKPTNLQVEEGT